MRKLVLSVAVSLDGYIEGPNGEYDWCLTDEDYGLSAFFKRVDSLFMGRKTYEMMLSIGEAPAGFPKFKEYVFSNTLTNVKDGARLIKGDIKQQVEKIKNEEGRDIWLFGGAGLTTSLLNMGLVDEMMLGVHPILLGAGKPLFKDIMGRKQLKLMDSKTHKSGLVMLTYEIK